MFFSGYVKECEPILLYPPLLLMISSLWHLWGTHPRQGASASDSKELNMALPSLSKEATKKRPRGGTKWVQVKSAFLLRVWFLFVAQRWVLGIGMTWDAESSSNFGANTAHLTVKRHNKKLLAYCGHRLRVFIHLLWRATESFGEDGCATPHSNPLVISDKAVLPISLPWVPDVKQKFEREEKVLSLPFTTCFLFFEKQLHEVWITAICRFIPRSFQDSFLCF